MNTTHHISAGQTGARLAVSILILFALGAAPAQPPAGSPAAAPAAATAPSAPAKPFKPEEFEQLVAQIALYPDSLLSQVLMASTYPVEVVQAERWMNENKDLKGDALTTALEKKTWDPSVKSLVAFPQVLVMMSKQLEWTTKLGDAFISDQKAVMAAVQKLRAKAQATGNLKSTSEQKVSVQKPEPQQPQVVVVEGSSSPPPPAQVIVIEPTNPQVVYVPTYNPTVVYGAWPYPYYPPPAPYYPPGYVASNLVSFGAGVAVGAAWGYAWGGCNWGHGEVDIDVDRNTNFNRNINRESYRADIQNRTGNSARGGQFQHDPAHRKGASYRDQSTANRYGGAGATNAARARDSYRGRAEAGRQDIARGGASDYRGNAQPAAARSAGSFDTGRAGGLSDTGRAGGSSGARTSQSPSRSSSASSSAFSGVNQGGSAARSSSSRGNASRSSAPSRSYSAPSRSSGGGGGGGGSRGGGGRGGGGRGGGRR